MLEKKLPQIRTINDLESFLTSKLCLSREEFDDKLRNYPDCFIALDFWDHTFEQRHESADGREATEKVTTTAFAFTSPALLMNILAAIQGKPDAFNLMVDGTFKLFNQDLVLVDFGTTTIEYHEPTQEHRQHFIPFG